MKILITGGNTKVPIDRVRVISNIFRGKTAISITVEAYTRGHDVTLVGNPEMRNPLMRCKFLEYKTFDDLERIMKFEITGYKYDCVIHSAAVSDYLVSRVLGPDMKPLDSTGKVGSSHERIYLEMTPTRKIVDEIRPWGFQGVLVKFKLQVGVSDEELLAIAGASREHSEADIIVANCLEWSKERAYIVNANAAQEVTRDRLPIVLMDEIGNAARARI